MRKLLFAIFLVNILISGAAQSIRVLSSGNARQGIEAIILQEKDFGKDTAALKDYLRPLTEAGGKQNLIIYDGLLANGFARSFDGVNETSNFFYLQSVEKAKELDNVPLQIWAQLNYAAHLYHFRNMAGALPFFMDAINNINNSQPDKMILAGESFKKIGYFMGTIGDNTEAINYLKKALQYTKPGTTEYATVLDNIGLYYFYAGNLANAEQYFNRAAKVSEQIGDQVRYGKTLGNLALIHQKTGNYEAAIELIKKDIELSELHRSDQNTMYAYILLGRLLLQSRNIEGAENALKRAAAIARSKPYFQNSELEITKLKLEIFAQLNKPDEELIAWRRLSELEDSLEKTDGDMALNRANLMAQKTRYSQELDKTNAEFKHEAVMKRLFSAIAFMALLLIVLITVNARQKLKKHKDDHNATISSFMKEKIELERRLSKTHNDLKTQIDYLKDKNEQIRRLNTEIDKMKTGTEFYVEHEKGKLQELLESHLMTEENWISFKREFKKEYPHWYRGLSADFPELTESNLRIVLLVKLGFTNAEISGLLGITADAVRKSKERLKKRIGERSESLFGAIPNQ